MREPRGLVEPTTLAAVQRASLSAAFCSKLRSTLENGEAAVNALIRTYDTAVADHHLAVSEIAIRIARRLGIAQDTARGIELACSIHDIGEIGIGGTDGTVPRAPPGCPSTIHPLAGASIVDGIRFPWPIATMIVQHHERMDGSGYPDGTSGQFLLVGSRVLAVADVTATRTERVRTLEQALDQLDAGRGSLYDADVVDACLELFPGSCRRVLRPKSAAS
jgi:HD-GYP domain-containing protein (c-di-GMP phosphodiesterase class II)